MKITRVLLRPLRKTAQLKKFRASNCVFCGFEGGMFTMTFQLDNADAEEVLQDLAIDFTNKHLPKVFISEPYYWNNAETESEG